MFFSFKIPHVFVIVFLKIFILKVKKIQEDIEMFRHQKTWNTKKVCLLHSLRNLLSTRHITVENIIIFKLRPLKSEKYC